jgi:Ca2+-binding EF-hand superfamily protein
MKLSMIAAVVACAMTGCAAEPSAPANDRVALDKLPQRPRAHVASADVNHDGAVDGRELAQFYGARTRELFHLLDRNGDGKLDSSELPSALQTGLPAADRDGDGALSVDEFVALHDTRVLEHLLAADADGDGALEPDEIGPLRWARLQGADTDGDGKLSFAELRHALGHRRAVSR